MSEPVSPEHEEALHATARAQRVLAGEEAPPVEFDKRLGANLDLVSGRVTCGACGMDTLRIVKAVALPSYLSPEMILAGMTCRTCQAEQAITLTQEDGAVVLATTRPR